MAGLIVTLGSWLVSLFLVCLGVFYLYVKSVYKYFERRGIPYDRPIFPFGSVTALITLRKSMSLTFADMYARHKHNKLVGYFTLWTKNILLINPDLVKTMFIKDSEVFLSRGMYYNKKKDPLSAHLVSIGGNYWRILRTKLSPTFSSVRMKGMHSIIVDCAEMLSKFVEQQQTTSTSLDCQWLFYRYAQKIIASTAFGLEGDSLEIENAVFANMMKKFGEPTLERFLIFVLYILNRKLATVLNIRVVPKAVSEFVHSIVKNTIKYREDNNIIRNDYLQLLMEMRNSNSGAISLTEEELEAQAFVFLVAGSETTAATMSFCLYELSRHPDIQARLHRELDSLPDLSYDSVNSSQYLDMVVCETLRKHPPVGFLTRECSRNYQVPETNVVIEKGTQVLVSVHGMHNDPDLFPDPEVFNPDRFSKENKDSIKPYTYMPFGEGPRYCIGNKFGLMVVKTGLASLIRRFHVSHPHAAPLKIEPRTAITTVSDGLWLTLETRR